MVTDLILMLDFKCVPPPSIGLSITNGPLVASWSIVEHLEASWSILEHLGTDAVPRLRSIASLGILGYLGCLYCSRSLVG
jgi:hypothetical protein